jgi:ribosomal protein L11 methylase PrmA
VREPAAADFAFVRATPLIRRLIEKGWLLQETLVERPDILARDAGVRCVLEHPRLPFVSYPYEWSFGGLRAAALRHLDIQMEALEHAVVLSDATAYNLQFVGARPVFIDHLSFRRYRTGEYWTGYRQFCDQFLHPLLLSGSLGIPFNGWYRGMPDGLPGGMMRRLLPLRRKVAWRTLMHVVLPARLQTTTETEKGAQRTARLVAQRAFPRTAFVGMLKGLRAWIARLEPSGGRTQWDDYDRSVEDAAVEQKTAAVREFVSESKPSLLFDLGCNTGRYAEEALKAGAGYVVGLEADPGALEGAFARASERMLAFVPLAQDLANPSPSQGWAEAEHASLGQRGPAEALLALAIVHHLAIGRNVPLAAIARWLRACAPSGLVEFVPKNDRRVQQLLALRDDVFPEYSEAAFVEALSAEARIVVRRPLDGGRVLFQYSAG